MHNVFLSNCVAQFSSCFGCFDLAAAEDYSLNPEKLTVSVADNLTEIVKCQVYHKNVCMCSIG